jgi:hypothetical protein
MVKPQRVARGWLHPRLVARVSLAAVRDVSKGRKIACLGLVRLRMSQLELTGIEDFQLRGAR